MIMRKAVAVALALSLPLSMASPAAIAAPRTVTLNPGTIRSMLVRNNLPVLIQLSKVRQAKESVGIARGNLLPRLNLGATLTGLVNGSFGITSVAFLLPFLMPSNWANLRQSQALLESQKVSYKLVQLNQYASAYSVYATVLGDLAIREVLVSQYNDLVQIRDWLIQQQRFIGTVPQEDIDNASARAKLAYANISAMDELLLREKAALRQMLALDLNAEFNFQKVQIPASSLEAKPLSQVVAAIQKASPESVQINYLAQAARSSRFEKMFGFMSGVSLNVAPGENGFVKSFSQLSMGSGFSIGFDYVPSIRLADENIREIQLRARELRLQQQQLAEATIGSIVEVKKQLAANAEAEELLEKVYQAEFRKYTLGLSDLLHLFEAQAKISQATAARVKSQLDLDLLRITLHRALVSSEFSKVPGCRIRPQALEKDRSFFRRLFRPKEYQLSIDEACAPAI